MDIAKVQKLKKWDIQDNLDTAKDVSLFLEAAFEDGDPILIAAALGDVARSRGMSELAKKTGISRKGLYKALSADGNPRLETLISVLDALDLKLRIEAA